MDSDITTQLLTVQAAGTRQSAEIAVMRKSQEMETTLLDVVDQASVPPPPPPPPGQGRVVDKQA